MKVAFPCLLPSLQSIVDDVSGFAQIPWKAHESELMDEQTDLKATNEKINNTHLPFSALHKPNRYKIAGPNNVQTLTVPITQIDKHNPISHVHINYNENWIRDHKQAWQTAYGKSPFFEFYDYRFWSILDQKPEMLADLLYPWNQLLLAQLGISLDRSSVMPEESQTLNHHLQKAKEQNSKLLSPYPQVFDVKFGFRNDVSGIDLLFNQGPLAKEYLSQYIPTNTIFAP